LAYKVRSNSKMLSLLAGELYFSVEVIEYAVTVRLETDAVVAFDAETWTRHLAELGLLHVSHL
jgi:hypothetical protein